MSVAGGAAGLLAGRAAGHVRRPGGGCCSSNVPIGIAAAAGRPAGGCPASRAPARPVRPTGCPHRDRWRGRARLRPVQRSDRPGRQGPNWGDTMGGWRRLAARRGAARRVPRSSKARRPARACCRLRLLRKTGTGSAAYLIMLGVGTAIFGVFLLPHAVRPGTCGVYFRAARGAWAFLPLTAAVLASARRGRLARAPHRGAPRCW